MIFGNFPEVRLRRNRYLPWTRRMLAENSLTVNDLVQPLFIKDGTGIKEEIKTMPDIYRYNIDELIQEVKEMHSLGVLAIVLFPITDHALKDNEANYAFDENNLIFRAVRAIKSLNLDIGIICDVALDPYTITGHDGIVVNDDVDNDLSSAALAKYAVMLANAGCDMVAPSDMMDGRIGLIRKTLDANGHYKVMIMSYAAKYNSNFYGSFRDAVGSNANKKGSGKSSYQMDYANANEALREVAQDITEGADIVMVKPGLPYLDIVKSVSDNFNIPVAAYQVSGEYSMIKFAHEKNIIDSNQAFIETLTALKRGGAKIIFTYAAKEIAKILAK
jgi:porphobilinogen synthase